MDPQDLILDNLAHAQWRVNFIRHLLRAHVASPWKGTQEWQEQHADMLHQLASAEDEVQIYEQSQKVLEPILGSEGVPPPNAEATAEIESGAEPQAGNGALTHAADD